MTDIIDQTQYYDEIYLRSAIRAHCAGGHDALISSGTTECLDCGDEIEDARRKAVPTATRCIDCQTKYERTQRRRP